MNTKLPIFIVVASILTMAVYAPSTHFVSGTTDCYALTDTNSICITKLPSSEKSFVAYCAADKDGKYSCQGLNYKTKVSPAMNEALVKAQSASLAKSNVEGSNSESTINNSPNPPQCPTTGPIPPDCTMKPPLK